MSKMPRIYVDGLGNAGQAVLAGLMAIDWGVLSHPAISLRDDSVWLEKHAEAGLVERSAIHRRKAEESAARLLAANWTPDRLEAWVGDVRDVPRSAYHGGVTFALCDSHACKCDSVRKSLQVGSPAVTIGLDRGQAIVECFAPAGAHYCCIHGNNPAWTRRQPCANATPVSTTQLAWVHHRDVVLQAGKLAAGIAADFVKTGSFPGGAGFQVLGDRVDPFTFQRNTECIGPHDRPFPRCNSRDVAGRPEQICVYELLDTLGRETRYADREVAWRWNCPRCGRELENVHVVHPQQPCGECGRAMQPGIERASGLSKQDLLSLQSGRALSLADLGLARESVIRCLAGDRELIWVRVRGDKVRGDKG